MCSWSQYLLNSYCVLDTVLGAKAAALNKRVAPPSWSFLLVQETDLEQPVMQAATFAAALRPTKDHAVSASRI